MILRDGGLIAKRGITLPITVRESIGAEELLEKAVEKHHRFNKDVVRSGSKVFYHLHMARNKNWTAQRNPSDCFRLTFDKGTCPKTLRYKARANITADQEFKTDISSIRKKAEQSLVGALVRYHHRRVEKFTLNASVNSSSAHPPGQ